MRQRHFRLHFLLALIMAGTLFRVEAQPAAGSESSTDFESLIAEADAYVNSNADSAVILCDKYLLSDKWTHTEKCMLLTVRGNAYFSLGDNDRAISDLDNAVKEAEEAGDLELTSNALSDLGVMYRTNQQPDSALKCYRLALEIAEEGGFPDLESSTLTSIAILIGNQGRPADGVPYAEKGLAKAIEADDLQLRIYAASTLGTSLFLAGEHDRALKVEREIVAVAEKYNVPRYILKTYASIIAMHNRLNHPDSVSHYINLGNRLIEKVPEASIESLGFLEQSSDVLTSMGKYRESLDIQKRILMMRDSRPFMALDKLWVRIAENYKGLGDIENMGKAYARAIEIADSVHNGDIDGQIAEWNVRFETKEKELSIARLTAEKSRRDTVIAIIAGIMVLGAVILLFILRSRRRKAELASVNAHLEGIEQERGRLAHELHDGVCNDLLGIELAMAAPGADREEVAAMLRITRAEVRAISHELLPPSFNGLTLPQLLGAYSLKSDGFVEFSDDGAFPTLTVSESVNLYRIVQEWVSNLRTHSTATQVSVFLSAPDGHPKLEITDDGAPFNPEETQPGRGLGLDNLKRRVQVLDATMTYTSEEGKNVLDIKMSGSH